MARRSSEDGGVHVTDEVYNTRISVLGAVGLGALIAGGVFFTVGGLIIVLEKPNPLPGRFGFHEIWHCCVVAGAASHYFAR